MERYPFDILPSGNLFSDLVEFADYYSDPFMNDPWQLTRTIITRRGTYNGEPEHFPQQPLHFADLNEFVEEQPHASYDPPDGQLLDCDILPQLESMQYEYLTQEDYSQVDPIENEFSTLEDQPQVEPTHYEYIPQEEQLELEPITYEYLPQEDQPQVEPIQYDYSPQQDQPQVEPITYERPLQEDQPQVEPSTYEHSPQEEQPQVEPNQCEHIPQEEEQPQGADSPQEGTYPENNHPWQRVWVHSISLPISSSYLPYTTPHTIFSVTNEPILNSNNVPVLVSSSTQRILGLFAQTIDVIDITPTIAISPQAPCSDIPAISARTPLPPPQEEKSERVSKKIPVPVQHIKPLENNEKSVEARKIQKKPSVHKREYRCDVSGCNKAFTSNRNLKRHEVMHSDLKPYKCEVPLCKWQFKRLSELSRHMNSKHSSEKNYRCGICKIRFSRQDYFMKHQKSCSVRKSQCKKK